MSFCIQLKKAREIKGLTQKDLAERLGLSAPSIVAYEAGNKKPSFDILLGLSKELNVSLDDLCETERAIVTWADAKRLLVDLVSLDFYVRVEERESGYPVIAFSELIVRDDDEGNKFVMYEDDPKYDDAMYESNDYVNIGSDLGCFLIELHKMRNLLATRLIDEELFELWLDKAYRKRNFVIKRLEEDLPF